MKTTLLSFLAIGALLFIGSCKTEDTNPVADTSNDRSTFNVRMTDGPGPYEKVMINVQEVTIHVEGHGWINLPLARPGFYNLPDLTNGTDTLLASLQVPTGRVSQVRLILGEGNYLVLNGTNYPLQTPSAEQSGVKLNIQETLVKDLTYTLWIDFDADKSIHTNGNGYSLKPVMRGYFAAHTGMASGTISPVTSADFVYAVHTQIPADTFQTWLRSDGFYKLMGLPTGLYTFTFVKAGAVVKTVNSVSIGLNNETGMGTVMIP